MKCLPALTILNFKNRFANIVILFEKNNVIEITLKF